MEEVYPGTRRCRCESRAARSSRDHDDAMSGPAEIRSRRPRRGLLLRGEAALRVADLWRQFRALDERLQALHACCVDRADDRARCIGDEIEAERGGGGEGDAIVGV